MVALLVILTFAVMLVVDHLLLRQPILIAEEAATPVKAPRRLSPLVAGFVVPENVSFHPGHTWATPEAGDVIRIGVDDFAAKAGGAIERINVPARGQWIRQGQKIFTMRRDGRNIELVSPIEGTVVDVNDKAIADPELARQDPYGAGWLLQVNSPDWKTSFRNLLNGTLARRWMDDAAARLRTLTLTPAGALAQEGGVAVDDVIRSIPEAEWQKASREFFLTA